MIHDVVVVGAGPGGSSVATFLARSGVDTLILDKSAFPRDKVCGDGLTPQAIYWLDRLGCVDEVLAETKACIRDCDLFINGEHLLTGGFPSGTDYPDFATLLDRRRFDNILVENAVGAGARFEPRSIVRGVEREKDCARVLAERDGEPLEYRARIVVGADGVNSVVSRAIGNALHEGTTAVSLRTYFRDVAWEGSQIKVYFDRDYFPGYGWLFVDDDGFANVGLGYAFGDHFPLLSGLRGVFQRFVERDLGPFLAGATRCGGIRGGAASFYRPKSVVSERVMLIGDAANQADPLNGGGIHKAMESAFFAAEAARHALEIGDFSHDTMRRYEEMRAAHLDLDQRTGELFLAIALNPDLKDFCLYLLTQIGRLSGEDQRFKDFCSGVFSGVIAHDACLSPRALYHALPKDPRVWLALLDGREGAAGLMRGAFDSIAGAGVRMAADPLRSLAWGLEVATRACELADRGIRPRPAVRRWERRAERHSRQGLETPGR